MPFVVRQYTEHQVETMRADYIRQAEEALEDLRTRQGKREGNIPVKGADVERKLARLLHLIRPRVGLPQNADYFVRHFDAAHRHALFVFLDDIEEQIPWRGFSMARAFDAARRTM